MGVRLSFRMQLGICWSEDRNRLSSKFHGLASPRESARLLALGMICLVLNRLSIPLDSCWLLPTPGATTVPLGISAHDQCCGLYILDYGLLPSLALFTVPSGTMGARPQEGGFQIRTIWDHPSSVSYMHGVFIMRCAISL